MKYAKTVCKHHSAVLANNSDLPNFFAFVSRFSSEAEGKRTLKTNAKRCLQDFMNVERVRCLSPSFLLRHQ